MWNHPRASEQKDPQPEDIRSTDGELSEFSQELERNTQVISKRRLSRVGS